MAFLVQDSSSYLSVTPDVPCYWPMLTNSKPALFRQMWFMYSIRRGLWGNFGQSLVFHTNSHLFMLQLKYDQYCVWNHFLILVNYWCKCTTFWGKPKRAMWNSTDWLLHHCITRLTTPHSCRAGSAHMRLSTTRMSVVRRAESKSGRMLMIVCCLAIWSTVPRVWRGDYNTQAKSGLLLLSLNTVFGLSHTDLM